MTDENQPIPRCLMESYNRAFARNEYLGTALEWVNLQHLLYRTSWKGDKPALSKARWLQGLLELDK